jgi:RNA polymerase sigma factor (sigma-70 family)
MSSYASNLATPKIHAAIAQALRRLRIPPAEIGDLRQVVLAKALATKVQPATLEECEALVRKIARDAAFDWFRRRSTRGKYEVGPCEDPDGHAEVREGDEPLEVREQIASVQRDLEQGRISQRQAAILERIAEGVPQTEIAQELGLAHQTVRNELSAARKTARSSWAAYAAIATVLCVIGVLWKVRAPQPDVVGSPPSHVPDDASAPEPAAPEAVARELRHKAVEQRGRHAWQECLRDLDKAAAIDPAGDHATEVQGLRADCVRSGQSH